jgi:hypothetical protein
MQIRSVSAQVHVDIHRAVVIQLIGDHRLIEHRGIIGRRESRSSE